MPIRIQSVFSGLETAVTMGSRAPPTVAGVRAPVPERDGHRGRVSHRSRVVQRSTPLDRRRDVDAALSSHRHCTVSPSPLLPPLPASPTASPHVPVLCQPGGALSASPSLFFFLAWSRRSRDGVDHPVVCCTRTRACTDTVSVAMLSTRHRRPRTQAHAHGALGLPTTGTARCLRRAARMSRRG
jgi:hypothetical protein